MKGKEGVVFALLSMMVACATPYKEVWLEPAPVGITNQWTELRSERRLEWTEPEQELIFHIDSVHQVSLQLEIIGQEGKRGVPEVEMVEGDGRTFPMTSHGFLGEDMFFTMEKPPLASYQGIRIRSGVPIRISNVRWRGYDMAEVKR